MKLLTFFAILTVFCLAQATPPEWSIEPKTPPVDRQAQEAWQQNLFEMDEYWILADADSFFENLRKNGLTSHREQQLKRHLYPQDKVPQRLTIIGFHKLYITDMVLVLPADLKSQLPPPVLQAAYRDLVTQGRTSPKIVFPSRAQAEAFFDHYNITGELRFKLRTQLYIIHDQIYLFFTPNIWKELPATLQTEFISIYTKDHESRRGLVVDLTYSAEDIPELVKQFAGERDPRVLERFLRYLLSKGEGGKPPKIPFSQILHSFIRKKVDTYSVCSGPNCFNSALSVNQGNQFRLEFIGDEGNLVLNRIYQNYRNIAPNENLQIGDLLLYRNASGQLVHAATYVTPEIVFTKNGLTKFHPYILQNRKANEEIYFPDGKFILSVFRIPKGDQQVLSPTGFTSSLQRDTPYLDRSGILKCSQVFY